MKWRERKKHKNLWGKIIFFFVACSAFVCDSPAKALESKKPVKAESGQEIADIYVSNWVGKQEETYIFKDDMDAAQHGGQMTIPVQYFKRDSILRITPHKEIHFMPKNGICAVFTSYRDTDAGLLPDTQEEILPPTEAFEYIFNTYTSKSQADLYRLDFKIRLTDGTETSFESMYYKIADTSPFSGVEALSKNVDLRVDGKKAVVGAYRINDTHYFEVQDLAMLLSGTMKPFDIRLDHQGNVAAFLPHQAYTGSHTLSVGNGALEYAHETMLHISVNGQVKDLTAYQIHDRSYVKLRDIGKILDFAIGWDDISQIIVLNTKNPYAVSAFAPEKKQLEGLLIPCPTYTRISDPYGYRIHPITGRRKLHKGMDFAAKTGEPVLAAANGTVIKSYLSTSFGHCVIILHENGMQTLYAHMAGRFVIQGQRVTAGQKIGTVGATGRATGAHLHFEVHPDANGATADPMKYFSPSEVEKYIKNHKEGDVFQ